jgi:hypothetical protein
MPSLFSHDWRMELTILCVARSKQAFYPSRVEMHQASNREVIATMSGTNG